MNSSNKLQFDYLPDLPPETKDEIKRLIGDFSVVLFGVSPSRGDDPLSFSGSGTLVTLENSHYILTAAHVWGALTRFEKIGIPLKERSRALLQMETDAIEVFPPQPPKKCGEWGPDLCFLRVPPEYAGSIKAYRNFYNLTKERPHTPGPATGQTWVLMGTAEADGHFTKTEKRLPIVVNCFRELSTVRKREGFDYIDMGVNFSLPGVPKSLRGMSGGGLWQVLLFKSAPSDKLEGAPVPKGVAFWESFSTGGRRFIRCHGPRSIGQVMRCLRTSG